MEHANLVRAGRAGDEIAIASSIGRRESPTRQDQGASGAQLVRRAVGHACGNGEPLARGAVVADEAGREPWAAPGGVEPMPGSAATQDRLQGALPERRRVRRARVGACKVPGPIPCRSRGGAVPALHRCAQVGGVRSAVGTRPRRPGRAARFQVGAEDDLVGVAGARDPRHAAAPRWVPLGGFTNRAGSVRGCTNGRPGCC